jgi:hypothetical protein
MTKIILNNQIVPQTWLDNFSRTELRKIARTYGIARGRNKWDTSQNLYYGTPINGDKKVIFELRLIIF